MDELPYKKVRAAAVAGWWTLLVGIGFGIVVGFLFMMILRERPAWIASTWGGLSWETIETVGVWMLTVYRLSLWLIFLLVVWLTIWAAKLRRSQ